MLYDKKMALGHRVRDRREELGLSQAALAERVTALCGKKVEQGNISNLENRDSRTTAIAPYLAQALSVDISWLLLGGERDNAVSCVREDPSDYPSSSESDRGKSVPTICEIDAWDDETPHHEDDVSLRFLKSVRGAAGHGSAEHDETDNGYRLRFSRRTLNRLNVVPDNAVCIVVSGNSMEPQLPDGCTVGVNLGDRVVHDGKIYAVRHEDMIRIKVLYLLPGGGIRMKSYNSEEHPDERYTAIQVREQGIEIIGRVFWSSVLY